jgi:DNA-binding CsgD family transcriptional regulator
MLVGRDSELQRVLALVDAAEAGNGGTLVVRGEAGIGKTTLLVEARAHSRSNVISTTGIEAESELRFAALGDVLRPLLGSLDQLAATQAEAVRVALGLSPPQPVDRLLLGGATLALLAAAAPLLVVVDDAQWLDAGSQDALVFAARRLAADPVAILFAARDGDARHFDAEGIESLTLSGLPSESALTLLGDRVSSVRVAHELVERTGGNPLALVELPATLSEAQLSGSEPLEEPLRVGAAIERGFSRRVQLLGEKARFAVLTAAADSSGDVSIVTSVVGAAELDRAEDAGLLRQRDGRLEFCHPLVRSAVYHGAAPSERRCAHAALAEASRGRDEERRVWHLAAAAVGEDAETAARLHEVGEQNVSRGAYGAAAAAFERAARLGPPGAIRARRFAAAADAAASAGRLERAAALVDEGLAGAPAGASRGSLLAAGGRLALLGGDQRAAFDAFLEAAELTDDGDATALLTEAVQAGVQLGGRESEEAARRLRVVAAADDPVIELLVAQALGAAQSQAGDVESVDSLARAVELVDSGAVPLGSARDLFLAGRACFMLGRNGKAAELARRATAAARETGALGLLPQTQRLVAAAAHDSGDWQLAYAAAGDSVDLAAELGQSVTACACLGLLADIDAAAGNESACADHAGRAIELALELGLGFYRERAERALAHLELVLGRVDAAAEHLEQIAARLRAAGNFEQNVTPAWDLVEAYVRAGRPEEARRTLERAVTEIPPASPGELAVVNRCRGLVEDDFGAWFEAALASHSSTDTEDAFPFHRARTQLCFGERLRRAGNRVEARHQLHEALASFDELGARAWAARTDAELRATGERRRSSDVAREELTPRETQIALAVADGQSNRDVAAALYVTPKTVEFHLTRIYRKLGVRSRAELVKHYRS